MRLNPSPLAVANPLSDLFSDPFFRFDWAPERPLRSSDHAAVPVNFYEDADNYYVRAEMPGVKKDELKVEFDRDLLTLAFERKTEQEESSFRRSLRVPQNIQKDAIRASLVDGILTLTLPKGEELKPREILVN